MFRACTGGVCLLAAVVSAQTRVREISTGLTAAEEACALEGTAERFAPGVPQVMARIVVSGVRAGADLRAEFVGPGGTIAESARYEELPRARSLCLMAQLPVGGFAAASQPGVWRVRVMEGERTLGERTFEIEGDRREGVPKILRLDREEAGAAATRLVVTASGAHSETSVNLAQYTRAGGWRYLAHLLPERSEGGRITVSVPPLQPAEYLVILRNPDGVLSLPARFTIATNAGYRLPFPAGERWTLTQGPYGSFSHWGRSSQAYDLAPGPDRWVAAMRPGVVEARDLGLGQTPRRRIFGNYVSIRHDDGEYSHYAHLRSGTFVVRSGQRVEAGQKLAQAGNSGYSFGTHVHVHVTKEARIAAASIPFRFEEAPDVRRALKRVLVSGNGTAGGLVFPAQGGGAPRGPDWQGSVSVAEWWTQVFETPGKSQRLEVRVEWDDPRHGFDLHLMSPSGRHFLAAGSGGKEETLSVEAPEPGPWRVSVQGSKGVGGTMPFRVEREVR
jgi:murein DD-endopeptidase MepM/ murein hydrolase activator NlpD